MAKKIKTRKSTANKPHVIIDAGPGSGKSTTCIAGLNIMSGKKPAWYDQATDEQHAIWEAMDGVYHSIGFMAFNKSIVEELTPKMPKNVEVRTFHSYGYKVLREAGYKIKCSQQNTDIAIKEQLGYDREDRMSRDHYELLMTVKKLVGLCKNNLLEPTKANLLQLAKYNNVEVNGNITQLQSLCEAVINKARRIQPGEFQWIDFDDMIWLPITLDLDFAGCQFDLLICDEAQDLNPVQHELVIRSAKRLIAVGDVRQAIYGFRGADAHSIETMKSLLEKTDRGVMTLPLQTTFRLPTSAVANVNEFAPNLRAAANATEGVIERAFIDEVNYQPGDLVVSRINANIFSLAFSLLKKRVPVRIQGREFGQQLINIIKKNCDVATDGIDQALAAIEEYDQKERARLDKKQFNDRLIDAHQEKISCLYALAEGSKTAADMVQTIEQLFDNTLRTDEVVLLSTVHRAKGLESDRVLFLEPNLVPHPMAKLDHERAQEYNLKFVAETRHKQTLVYVYDRDNEDERDNLREPVEAGAEINW